MDAERNHFFVHIIWDQRARFELVDTAQRTVLRCSVHSEEIDILGLVDVVDKAAGCRHGQLVRLAGLAVEEVVFGCMAVVENGVVGLRTGEQQLRVHLDLG